MIAYLDNNATTKVAPEVVETMKSYWSESYGNPSSIHSFGGNVSKALKHAREQIAELINASSSEEIYFTAGGTESDNLAIKGVIERDSVASQRRHIITTKVEHPAVQSLCKFLNESRGHELSEISVDKSGSLNLDELKNSIKGNTSIISVMWANNETGVVFPMDKVVEIAKSKNVLVHSDCVQALGKMPVDVQKVPVDILSFSAHKLHGPKGVGAIYIRKGTKIVPQIIGGHQESGLRSGTENVSGIVGFGRACELAKDYIKFESKRVAELRDKLQTGLLKLPGARVNGAKSRVSNTLNISFEYIEGESILLLLDEVGIYASSGSACASGSLEPSHVLQAMNVPFTCIHGSIRFSLSRYTTEEEIDYTLQKMPAIVSRLREMSPFV